jgi:leader peptidase (prepilin peptidase)/N-methyltransferase
MFFGILAAALAGYVVGSLANVVAWRLVRGVPLPEPEEPPAEPGDEPAPRADPEEPPAQRAGPTAARDRLVEVSTAVLFVLVAVFDHDDSTRLLLGLTMAGFLVALTLVDLETRLLPNKLTLPAAVTAVVLGLLVDASGEPERLLAGAVAGGFFLVVALAYPRGMGLGDVKLAAVLGLFLGREVAAALLVGLAAGAVVGVVVMRRKGVAEGRKTAIPFGPFLALGAVAALLAGEGMVDAYLATF